MRTEYFISAAATAEWSAAAQNSTRGRARCGKAGHVTRTYRRDEFEVRALDDILLRSRHTRSWRSWALRGLENHSAEPGRGIDHTTSGSVVVGEMRLAR